MGSGIGETYQTLKQMDNAPPTPAAGYFRRYTKVDGEYIIGSDGVEIKVMPGNKNIASFVITQSITNGITNLAPSGDAVFDALALKAPLASPIFTGTVNASTIVSNGMNTNAGLPAFMAQPSGVLSDITGDGTEYTIVWATERFDQTNNFDGISTFTAPITGKYHFDMQVCFAQLTTMVTECELKLVSPSLTITQDDDFQAGYASNNLFTMTISSMLALSAGNTVVGKCTVNGLAGATVDINNGRSAFSGFLVC